MPRFYPGLDALTVLTERDREDYDSHLEGAVVREGDRGVLVLVASGAYGHHRALGRCGGGLDRRRRGIRGERVMGREKGRDGNHPADEGARTESHRTLPDSSSMTRVPAPVNYLLPR